MADNSENSEVKLIDFGLAKRLAGEAEKMTTVVGTPYYVAPEVLKGDYSKSCDIWSLGVILYVFLCGYPPFEGDNNTQIFKNVLNQELAFDPKEWSNISNEGKDVIRAMLVRDKDKRKNADEVLAMPWFTKQFAAPTGAEAPDMQLVLNRIKQFRAPLKLQ